MLAAPLARRPEQPDVIVGLDRVGWLRITVHADHRSYEAVGTARHRPESRPISPDTAARLLERGVRAVVHTCPECGG